MEPRTTGRSARSRVTRLAAAAAIGAAAILGGPADALAQLDPLLFLQRSKPNVIIAVDVANRMQYDADGTYYDPYTYPRTGAAWEPTIGVTAATSASTYRRTYPGLAYATGGTDLFTAASILTVGDVNNAAFGPFYSRTRLGVARSGLLAALKANTRVARFGLVKMRQSSPRIAGMSNAGPVWVQSAAQLGPTESGSLDGRWLLTYPLVSAANGSIASAAPPVVAADAAGANALVEAVLAKDPNQAGALLPAGMDSSTAEDAPLASLLADARAEAARLIAADTQCRNTVVILVTGGGEGTTSAGSPSTTASSFLNVNGNRVPIYVIAIAPPAASVPALQLIAANSGGGYFEITKAQIERAPAGMTASDVALAANAAIQHAFAAQIDVNTAPTAALPLGPKTESQTVSPVIGTVNLEGAVDITGVLLPNTRITSAAGTVVPQRSNLMVTAGFSLPGFEGRLRGFRVYQPQPDVTKPYGWGFVAANTRLWVSSLPSASERNIFTTLPTGGMIALTAANADALAPYLTSIDAAGLIEQIRQQPLGAIVDSTPAMLDPPSLDPPPDAEYAGFAAAHAARRSLVFVGANDGMLHAFDARTGLEAWAYVPFNLLPKLKALRQGQAVGAFSYFVDSSPKVADVKVNGAWRTYLLFGQGPGGTAYQALDVTLTAMVTALSPAVDDRASLLAFFSQPDRISHAWSFPARTSFDASIAPYGDIAAGSSALEKTVGETWSDPAVGQVESDDSDWIALVGSGFLSKSKELQPNRLGSLAGTTFYLIKMQDGTVLDSRDVGNDGTAETVDNCAVSGNCTRIKNALQSDPVATGPSISRYITKAYIGDLDGRVWRFNVGLDASKIPRFSGSPIKLFDAGNTQPIFASMASVNVGGSLDYLFFASGSDLLPSTGVNQSYKLFGILDTAGTGSASFSKTLTLVDGAGVDEKPSAFPAVAGDIIFFTTTSFTPATPCAEPTSNLYAMTFLGGAAYDTNGSGSVTSKDSIQVLSGATGRATAPFVVDQHLVFTAGGKVQIMGDPTDYNNGFGQVGVRILSWRLRR